MKVIYSDTHSIYQQVDYLDPPSEELLTIMNINGFILLLYFILFVFYSLVSNSSSSHSYFYRKFPILTKILLYGFFLNLFSIIFIYLFCFYQI